MPIYIVKRVKRPTVCPIKGNSSPLRFFKNLICQTATHTGLYNNIMTLTVFGRNNVRILHGVTIYENDDDNRGCEFKAIKTIKHASI